jgi:hypothetical protein
MRPRRVIVKLVYAIGATRWAVGKRPGDPVEVGDKVNIAFREGEKPEWVYVVYFAPPRSTASSGKVTVTKTKKPRGPEGQEYYVSAIGAEWIEREDRAAEDRANALQKHFVTLRSYIQPGDEDLSTDAFLKALRDRIPF